MTDKIHFTAQSHESHFKMPLPQQYERKLSQDIQLQVIIKENENLRRTKTLASPTSMKKPITRAQNISNDNIISVQYGKLNLNQSNDFRIAPRINNVNLYGHGPEQIHYSPTSFFGSKKSESKAKCLDLKYLRKNIRSKILEKHLARIWKYLKWPLLLFFLCTFIGFLTYTCINYLNMRTIASQCPNSKDVDCFIANKTNRSELNINSTFNKTNSLLLYPQSETIFSSTDVTDAVLKASTTILRPVIVPQLLQASYKDNNSFENKSEKGYTITERKQQNQEYEDSKDDSTKQNSYDQEHFLKTMKNKTETLNHLRFTSGHQNNFGIPIEEDERVLRLLNEELIKLEQQTERTIDVSRTESSIIVSPTVPLLLHELLESSTSSTGKSEEIQCQSTSLLMCRGVLQYDLTSSKAKSFYLTVSELKVFEELLISNCSTRSAEFICAALEPECRPAQIGSLPPCKRICKSILEACSSIIVRSDILTFTFDCDKYPESDDRNICEDPTRRTDCYANEFKCQDLSCIPGQWQCDNIKDCGEGEDELGCLICSPDEFRCRSNDRCLLDKYRCDSNEDCVDGSDERDCSSEYDSENPLMYPRIFSFASFLLPNFTSENSFTAISDEDRLASGSELNESLASAGGSYGFPIAAISTKEMQREKLSAGVLNISRSLAHFQDSKEMMMTSDTENKLKISQTTNVTVKNTAQTERAPSCIGNQLRCVSGKCITVDQLCDKVMDCPEGEDELMCVYGERPQPKKP